MNRGRGSGVLFSWLNAQKCTRFLSLKLGAYFTSGEKLSFSHGIFYHTLISVAGGLLYAFFKDRIKEKLDYFSPKKTAGLRVTTASCRRKQRYRLKYCYNPGLHKQRLNFKLPNLEMNGLNVHFSFHR